MTVLSFACSKVPTLSILLPPICLRVLVTNQQLPLCHMIQTWVFQHGVCNLSTVRNAEKRQVKSTEDAKEIQTSRYDQLEELITNLVIWNGTGAAILYRNPRWFKLPVTRLRFGSGLIPRHAMCMLSYRCPGRTIDFELLKKNWPTRIRVKLRQRPSQT